MEKRESFAQELCEILVKHGVIEAPEGRAMQRSFKNSDKESFDDFLLAEGLVEEKALLRALGDYYQLPTIDVVGYFFDTLLLRNFPKEFLLENCIIPLEEEGNILIMIAGEPDDEDLLAKIGRHISFDIQFQVGIPRDIEDSVKEFYDKSPTDLLDDDQMVEEELTEQARYHDLIKEGEEDIIPTVTQEESEEE